MGKGIWDKGNDHTDETTVAMKQTTVAMKTTVAIISMIRMPEPRVQALYGQKSWNCDDCFHIQFLTTYLKWASTFPGRSTLFV